VELLDYWSGVDWIGLDWIVSEDALGYVFFLVWFYGLSTYGWPATIRRN